MRKALRALRELGLSNSKLVKIDQVRWDLAASSVVFLVVWETEFGFSFGSS